MKRLLLFLLLVLPVSATPGYVQASANSVNGSTTVTTTLISTTAGNMIAVIAFSLSGTISGISDSQSLSWTAIRTNDTDGLNDYASIWCTAHIPGGSNTITITSSVYIFVAAMEFTGVNCTADNSGFNHHAATTNGSVSFSTTSTSDQLFGAFIGTVTPSAGPGFVMPGTAKSGPTVSNTIGGEYSSALTSSTGTQTIAVTSASSTWMVEGVAFTTGTASAGPKHHVRQDP